ncbi:MAG: class I SAM-dependent methyltransferase [Ilumatobacteraceae bacterium]
MSDPRPAARRWNESLQQWGIPQHILEQAPTSPWVHAPAMFRSGVDDPSDTPSMRRARSALRALGGGTVLDVGCGGGRSSLPLAPDATSVIGVDHQPAMLEQFSEAARTRGVEAQTVLGHWPAVAGDTPVADVAVCHHVVYNVGDIEPFVRELDAHARVLVVVELTSVHPQSSLGPLWRRFWDLDRPSSPTADDFVAVVRDLGHDPLVDRWRRDERPAPMTTAERVANLRVRLCLPADRDPEIEAEIAATPLLSPDDVVTVSWSPS